MQGRVFAGIAFMLTCLSAWSAPVERTLRVSVDIVVGQASSTLEIIAPRTDFLVVYLANLRRFQSLDIPFSVRRVDGNAHGYSLSLAQLTGQCELNGAVNSMVPTLMLDGQSFTSAVSVSGLANPDQAHVLNLVFPNIAQADVSQSCDGAVGIIAAATF
ncbi:TPA: hypothetical protein P2Q98_004563 [Aeromonas veronii]|uniref:hypothetical protein n=1 Tax=Aeromonas veronii TaxID=654 RepID=UPI00330935F0|nr:hypothetical protein [Aeromonas veronii]HDO1336288.1 hypothetical protein [Aeromonas veronii]HDO1340821.1 hypothetical protein [Aeromonas veronii]HDO1345336.1 hypothetical protein [Aeromonas veronii]HDO1349911.1 hypothetical protein [Aeromonas veronii]